MARPGGGASPLQAVTKQSMCSGTTEWWVLVFIGFEDSAGIGKSVYSRRALEIYLRFPFFNSEFNRWHICTATRRIDHARPIAFNSPPLWYMSMHAGPSEVDGGPFIGFLHHCLYFLSVSHGACRVTETTSTIAVP